MLGYFPQLYPDELLHSGLARLEAWVGYPNPRAFRCELFGHPTAGFLADLPHRLEALVALLPPGHPYTAEQLIDEHTLYPFYAAFLTSERRQNVKAGMVANQRSSVYPLVGLKKPQLPTHFRFCPACVEEDRQRYGETYWHRLHQLPGVRVCPVHHLWLVNSTMRWQSHNQPYVFALAEKAVQPVVAQPVNLSLLVDRVHNQLVCDAAWLLQQKHYPPHREAIRQQYLLRLAQRGLATYSGRVYISQLTTEFQAFFTPELLRELHCSLATPLDTHWLARLLRPQHSGAGLTIYHLLLMQFLGCSAAALLTHPLEPKPFGDGPYPCLNPASDHYGSLCIPVCQVEYKRFTQGRPTGVFTCACGFAYARLGPDTQPEDRFTIHRVLERGELWDAYLEKLWYDPAIKVRDLERLLHMNWLTIKQHVIRLKLDFPPPGFRVTCITRPLEAPRASASKTDPTPYREAWLALMRAYPDEGVTGLRKRAVREYGWLRHADKAWLEAHQPPPQKRRPRSSFIDWAQRDQDLCRELDAALERLQQRLGRPSHISRSALASETGRRRYFQEYAAQLPLATAHLYQLAESSDDWAVRRIFWAADEFRQTGKKPTRYQLTAKASVHHPTYKLKPVIQQTLDTALSSFEGGC